MGSDHIVSATGSEPSKARNFTLAWEGRLAALPRAGGGCRQVPGRGAHPGAQTHWYGPGLGRGPLHVGLDLSPAQLVSLPTRSTVISPGGLGQG